MVGHINVRVAGFKVDIVNNKLAAAEIKYHTAQPAEKTSAYTAAMVLIL